MSVLSEIIRRREQWATANACAGRVHAHYLKMIELALALALFALALYIYQTSPNTFHAFLISTFHQVRTFSQSVIHFFT